MPKSNALLQFEESLGSAKALIEFERIIDDPPVPGDKALAEGLRGGAAVLMVAAFENFLREMFAERVAVLSQQPLRRKFDDLPIRIKRTSVVGTLERAIRPPRYLVPKPDLVAAALAAGALVQQRVIDSGSFSETSGNPEAAVVKSMFKKAALGDIWTRIRPQFDAAWGKPEAGSFLTDKLDEIVNRRHRVAHTANALSIARAQLDEAPRFLEVIAGLLDSALEQHLEDVLDGKVK